MTPEHEAKLAELQAAVEMAEQARAATEAELAAVKAERDELAKEKDRLSPFVSIPVFESAADVVAHMGEEALAVIAETELATENKSRMQSGRPALHLENPVEYARLAAKIIERVSEEMVAQQRSWVSDDRTRIVPMRTAKMVRPDGGSIQIPLEGTINNAAGSMADPIERYKRKGFKLMHPIRCMLRDCWEAEAVDSRGRRLQNGFCGEFHRSILERATMRGSYGQQINVVGRTAFG
jgi:hypothetical protein